MSLFPDIATHHLEFMNFFFHLEGGYSKVREFWKSRTMPEHFGGGLGYVEVPGLSRPHTVSIQWRRSGDECCDVRLSIDARSPNELDLNSDYLISEEQFREFFDFSRKQSHGGIVARFGVRLVGRLAPIDIPSARLKSFVIEIGKMDTPSVTADFRRSDDGWLVIVEPSWRLGFLDKPVDDEFFKAPLRLASSITSPFVGGSQNGQ